MINNVLLLGTIEADPILEYTPNNVPYTRFRLETVRTWNQNGETKQDVNSHVILSYGRIAEVICQHLHADRKCCFEGHLKCRNYKGQEVVEVVATKMTFVDDRPKEEKKKYDTKNFTPDDIPF